MKAGTTKPVALDEPIKWKARTKPKDSLKISHRYVNQLAKEKFKVPVRNGVFCTTSEKVPEVMLFAKKG